MKFFLSLNSDGRQAFSVEGGKCTNLLKDAQVFTHHSSFTSKYTMDPSVIVEVNRLPLESLLSSPAIAKMSYPEGDNLIRAELGWLDLEVAPEEAELAMVIMFKENKIKAHSFLVGGKPNSYQIQLAHLDAKFFKNLDVTKKYTVGVDFSSIQFPSMRKATEWRKIEEMLKDSFTGCSDFANENVYARWRILEERSGSSDESVILSLCLELLPLQEKLKSYDAELLAKFNSSSNLAIRVLNIPLRWRGPDLKKKLFTSPCLVLDSRESSVTDSMVRLGMATVRDFLRMGRASKSIEEHRSTVSDPVVFHAWERSKRELFMSEAETFDVLEKGKTMFSLSLVLLKSRLS